MRNRPAVWNAKLDPKKGMSDGQLGICQMGWGPGRRSLNEQVSSVRKGRAQPRRTRRITDAVPRIRRHLNLVIPDVLWVIHLFFFQVVEVGDSCSLSSPRT